MSGGVKDHSAEDAALFNFGPDLEPLRPYTPIALPTPFTDWPEASQGRTTFAWFGYWFASYELKETVGYRTYLLEYTAQGWQPVTSVADVSIHAASRRAYYLARDLLITGQRPHAETQSNQLRCYADWYRATGEHFLRSDYERAQT